LTFDASKLSTEEARALEQRMQRASCAYFASKNLRGPPEAPYFGRFVIAQHHLEWDDIVTKARRFCILAPRDHGKCRAVGSFVLRVDGVRVPIEEWAGGGIIAYDPDTHALVRADASPSRPSGVQRCVRVTTRTGRVDVTTLNHRWRLWDRWQEAAALNVGDRVAVPRTLPVAGTAALDEHEAWLLGLLVGDGCTVMSTPSVTTTDPDVHAALIVATLSRGWVVEPTAGRPTYLLTNHKRKDGTSCAAFVRRHGIVGTAYEKRVPKAIFTAPLEDAAAFLAGYFDSDGHASTHGGGMLEYYSVSEHLLRDVQHLLCRLGVVGVLTRKLGKYKGADHHSWRITIRGRSVVTFAERVPVRGSRRVVVQALARLQATKDEGGSVDLLPKEVCTLISKSEDWLRKRGLPRFNRGYDMTRGKARAIADATGDTALRGFADAEVLWDEIVSIEDAGELETYCLDVPRLENYIGNDVITHNSHYINKAFPIWKAMFGNPGEIGYVFSANQERAVEMLEGVTDELIHNRKLQHLVPSDYGRTWSRKRIRLTTGVEIRARGFGVKVRGGHPHWIVNDDILTDDTITSETIRNKQIDYYYSAVSNMIIPGGQIGTIGTPLHVADLYAKLRESGVYTMWEKPALDPVTGEPLWPLRYDAAALKLKEQEIGSVRFTREYLVRPFSDSMSLFPSHLFDGDPTRQYTVKMGMPAAFWAALGIRCYVGVDIAMSAETGADYFVIFVLGVDGDGNRWVVDIYRDKGLPFRRQLDLIVEYSRRYDAQLVFVEANAAQRVWGDELIRTTDIPVKKFTTIGRGKGTGAAMSQTANKNDLEKGVPSLRPLLENQKFRIPMGDQQSVEKARMWIAEMQAFSFIDGKVQGVGSHDDLVMACFFADQAIRRGGFSASFGDEDARVAAHMSLSAQLAQAHDSTDVSGQNPSGASGDLGGSEDAGMVWTAQPFFGPR
jgi:hypothetical protein